MQEKMKRLFEPRDIASLVFFRMAFGLIMFWEVWRYVSHNWIDTYYIRPSFHFKYYGFEWVTAWPGDGMYYHFLALGILALCIAFGAFYRLATTLFFLGITYVFLLDQTTYLNHMYLVCLISFLLIFVPTHWNFSFDCRRYPNMRSDTIPAWALWLMRIQLGIPYFFGGIAKINPDWLRGEPLRMWLSYRLDYPWIGQYFSSDLVVYFFSYGGLFFDLLIVPALLWRKTRPLAYLLVLFFNLMNAWLFRIGIFPWFMIAATTLFFEPDWPRRLFKFSRQEGCAFKVPNLKSQYITAALLGSYLLVQFLMPFRHLLYPGVVHWNEEGHRFAWHMKLRDKKAKGTFYVDDPVTREKKKVSVGRFLNGRQYEKMLSRPDMILQFAHRVAEVVGKKEGREVAVYADVSASLNDRAHQQMIDPEENLAKVKRSLKHAEWVVPLQ